MCLPIQFRCINMRILDDKIANPHVPRLGSLCIGRALVLAQFSPVWLGGPDTHTSCKAGIDFFQQLGTCSKLYDVTL